jgi:S-(hydroxymethyl)glutathione dehydrogenase/alcohol dehydrogenase
VDYIGYRLEHAKVQRCRVINFEEHDNTGEYIKEITHAEADVVIDCVGMVGR